MQKSTKPMWARRSIRVIALIVFAAVFGCGGPGEKENNSTTNNQPEPEAQLSIAPINQDFGAVPVGETSQPASFTVTNGGDADSSELSVSVTGESAEDFVIVSTDCAGEVVSAGATCTIELQFSPSVAGDYTASLDVSAADGGDVAANLTGSGVSPPSPMLSPTPHDFGSVVVGEMSDTVEFTLTNSGGEETGELTATLNGGDAVEFSIADNGCSGTALAPEASCTIAVVFAPDSPGMKSTTLRVVGGAEDPEATAALSGEALAAASLKISPSPQDFGSVVIGESGTEVTFTVTNEGGAPTGTLTTDVMGTDAAEFTTVSDDCDGATVEGGAKCNIVMNFEPTSQGDKTAVLEVSGTPGGTVASDLAGVGILPGQLVIEPSNYNFGTLPLTQRATHTFTVRNDGDQATGALNTDLAGTNPGDFEFVSGANGCQGITLNGGNSCTVAVAFEPTAAGQRDATLQASAAPGGMATASLTGTGQIPVSFSITPASQGFGSVAVNTTSTAVTFTVENTGGQSATPSVTIGGTNATEFTKVADGCTVSLAPNDTCQVDVAFAPMSTGAKTATVDAVDPVSGASVSADIDGTGIIPGTITLSTTVLTFGDVVNGGTSNTQSVVLTNNGTEPTDTLTATVVDGEFTIVTDGCSGGPLDAGTNCTIELEFSPTTVGAATGTLEVNETGGATQQISLSGTSLQEFDFDQSSPYDFGTHNIGDPNPPTQVFTVTNTSGAGEQSRDLTAALGASADFSVVANSCTGVTVAPGDTCTVEVEFNPVSPPGDKTATITVTDANAVSYTLDLVGTGLSTIPLDIAPGSHDFVDQPGGTTDTVTFTVTNTQSITSGPLKTVFDANLGPYGLVSDTCAGNTLDAFGGTNDSCEVTVIFYPRSASNYGDASLYVESPSETTATVTISGNAVPPAELSIDDVTTPTTTIATESWERTYTVSNTGSVDTTSVTMGMTGSSIYSITTDDCTGTVLAPSETCTVVVTAAPQTTDDTGEAVGTLTADATAGGTFTRDITTTVESQLIIDGPTSPYTFSDTVVGDTSVAVTFVVENQSANAISTTLAASTTGPFEVVSNDCTSIAAGGTCSVDARFAPTSVGADQTGTLDVGSGPAGTATWELVGTSTEDAALTFQSASTDFGYATVGQTGISRTFVLENTGALATSTAPAFTFDPSANPDFDVDTSDCSTALNVGATCDVVVTFAPDTSGQTPLDITATADGQYGTSVSATLRVTGEGRAVTDFMIDPRGYLFSESPDPNQVSTETVTFTVSNDTGSAVNGLTIDISSSDFSIVSGQDNCSGQDLSDTQSCTFEVAFAPDSYGETSATVTVGSGGVTDSATVYGNSKPPAALEFTAGNPDYGNVVSGGARTETFTVTNTGSQSIDSIDTFLFGTDSSEWSIASDGCLGGLAAGGSCDIVVDFFPSSVGSFTTGLYSTPNVGSGTSVDLTGEGVNDATFDLTPDGPVDCADDVPAERSVDCAAFTVTNTGGVASDDFDVSLATGVEFAVTSTTCAETGGSPAYEALAGGDSCDVILTYTPDDRSSGDTDTLTVDDATTSDSSEVTGDAISALTTPASSSVQSFTATVGSSESKTFTYTNASGTPATDPLGVRISGTDADQYSSAGDCAGAALDAGESCTVIVTFVPTSTGSFSAVLQVDDGTANKSAGLVSLAGTAN